MMYGPEKSDPSVVAVKPANKAGQPVAERGEPRDGTKGNTDQPRTRRTQSRARVSPGLERVRNAARERKKEKFSALLHHVTLDERKRAAKALLNVNHCMSTIV
jgi:RNA-directed DNA polymerase